MWHKDKELKYHGFFSTSIGRMRTNYRITYLSLALNLVLGGMLIFGGICRNTSSLRSPSAKIVEGGNQKWNGGHPLEERPGSCWCSGDKYCMCTPNLAIDLVITSGKDHIWLVRRKDTDQLATMGGFVEVGETVEHAVKREMMEEMGVTASETPKLLGIYSDPRRDNRRHTVSAVYHVKLPEEAKPHAMDDVKDVIRIPISDIDKHTYFADHWTILMDYRNNHARHSQQAIRSSDFAKDIVRSTCVKVQNNDK
mmetsp:Transcript_20875/g.29007  ORF Transcript_20875/g.29007 Transcript_20875/m.29007 type:complete len:253 (+) Transcript_20875:17-775(+)